MQLILDYSAQSKLSVTQQNNVSIIGIVDFLEMKPAASWRDLLVKNRFSSRAVLLEKLCNKHGIPYFNSSIKHSSGVGDQLKVWQPDLVLTYGCPILPESLLSIASYGTINLHPSYLPKYRGSAPLFWVIHDKQPKIGVTVHYLNEGVDTGPIISQQEFNTPEGFTEEELEQWLLVEEGSKLLRLAFQRIGSGQMSLETAKPQSRKSSTRYSRRISRPWLSYEVDFAELPLDIAKNLLCFATYWKPWWGGCRANDIFFLWRVQNNYELGKGQCHSLNITVDGNKYWLSHPQGRIELKRQFAFVYAAKQLLKIVLGYLPKITPQEFERIKRAKAKFC